MIGYYIHHHGTGHLLRAQSICAALTSPTTALTSLPSGETPAFDDIVVLPRDDDHPPAGDPTASGRLHWAPRGDPGLRARTAAISAWIETVHPRALVVDVSVEVALLARLHGVPIITMALPGQRTDPPHQLLHEIADLIIAAWPRTLYRPDWLHPHEHKTCYTGGITRFAGRPHRPSPARSRPPTVLVLAGTGGTEFTGTAIHVAAHATPGFRWQTLGLHNWNEDPWPELCAADIVVANAGQGAVADIATAGKPAVLIPSPRPFDEQHATAAAVDEAELAVIQNSWPSNRDWPEILSRASDIDPRRWWRWETEGAAERAARAIERVAEGAFR